jgi:hypothetical protein
VTDVPTGVATRLVREPLEVVASREQFLVPTECDHATGFDDDYPIGVADRREPVRDRDQRPITAELRQCPHHGGLCGVVERCGALVEDDHPWIAVERSRDRDALSLPAGEADPPLPELRVEPPC